MKLYSALVAGGFATARAFSPAPFGARSSTSLNVVAVGDKLPSVELNEDFPPDKVNIAEYAKGKSILMIGLPGAFTPT